MNRNIKIYKKLRIVVLIFVLIYGLLSDVKINVFFFLKLKIPVIPIFLLFSIPAAVIAYSIIVSIKLKRIVPKSEYIFPSVISVISIFSALIQGIQAEYVSRRTPIFTTVEIFIVMLNIVYFIFFIKNSKKEYDI